MAATTEGADKPEDEKLQPRKARNTRKGLSRITATMEGRECTERTKPNYCNYGRHGIHGKD